jgi:hypothetical protein
MGGLKPSHMWNIPISHARQSLASGWGEFGFHWASPASMLCVGAFPVRMQAEPCFRMGCIWFPLGKSCVNALRWRLPSSHARQSLASGWGAFGFHWASPVSMLCVGAFPVRRQGRALLHGWFETVTYVEYSICRLF